MVSFDQISKKYLRFSDPWNTSEREAAAERIRYLDKGEFMWKKSEITLTNISLKSVYACKWMHRWLHLNANGNREAIILSNGSSGCHRPHMHFYSWMKKQLSVCF